MKKRIALILALIFILSSFVVVFSGCKKDDAGEESDTVDLSAEAEKEQYNREPEDLGGFELKVLTVKSGTWNMQTDLAPTELDGQVINTAVYERNMLVQSLYNAKIVAHEDAEYYGGTDRFYTDPYAEEFFYDAGYCEGSSVNTLVTSGFLMNLYDVPELQLDQNWWSQLIKKEATLGSGKYSKLYFTQSNLSLTAFDLTWCVYYNKDIHATNKIENLYDLVRSGEWTIDKMKTIAASAASLVDDTSYTYSKDGTSIYGITTYWNGAKALLDGCNVQYVARNSDGEPIPNIANERFMTLAQKLAELFDEQGTFTLGGPSSEEGTVGNSEDYKRIFNAKRALFCVAEVKSSVSDFREYDGDFGILPLPKYDSAQAEYRSWINYLAPVLVMPSSLSKEIPPDFTKQHFFWMFFPSTVKEM